MSRGLGKVEQYILNKVETDGYCLLKDVPALQPAVSRSAAGLQRKKMVVVYVFNTTVGDTRHRWIDSEPPFARHWVSCAFPYGTSMDEMQILREKYNLMPSDRN